MAFLTSEQVAELCRQAALPVIRLRQERPVAEGAQGIAANEQETALQSATPAAQGEAGAAARG